MLVAVPDVPVVGLFVPRNDGGFGDELRASTIAIAAPTATATERAAGSSQRGPRRRRLTAAATAGVSTWMKPGSVTGAYCLRTAASVGQL